MNHNIYFSVNLIVQKYAGMHMEEGHVVLNVCLEKKFTGGDMHFCGRRCANHMNSETHAEVLYSS
jgi:hypothetical protein